MRGDSGDVAEGKELKRMLVDDAVPTLWPFNDNEACIKGWESKANDL